MGTELESSLLGQELRCSRGVVEGIPVILALNLTLWLEEVNGMPLTERERDSPGECLPGMGLHIHAQALAGWPRALFLLPLARPGGVCAFNETVWL